LGPLFVSAAQTTISVGSGLSEVPDAFHYQAVKLLAEFDRREG
jgi:hypothetical protein